MDESSQKGIEEYGREVQKAVLGVEPPEVVVDVEVTVGLAAEIDSIENTITVGDSE